MAHRGVVQALVEGEGDEEMEEVQRPLWNGAARLLRNHLNISNASVKHNEDPRDTTSA